MPGPALASTHPVCNSLTFADIQPATLLPRLRVLSRLRSSSDPLAIGIIVLSGLVLAACFRVVWPDPTGLVFGDRMDSVHHVWGIWWAGATSGPTTDLVSFPAGERGSLLAPFTTALVRPVRALWGAALAHTILGGISIVLSAVGVVVLAITLGASRRGAAVGALLFVGARPVLGQVAMGNLEGAVLGPLLLGIAAGWVWPERRAGWGLLVGLLLGISVIENPYTLVPAGVLAPWLAWRRVAFAPPSQGRAQRLRAVGLAVLGGAGIVAARLAFTGGDMGGNLPGAWSTRILEFTLPIVDPGHFPLQQLWRPTWTASLQGPSEAIVEAGTLVWPGWLAGVLALACPRNRRGLLLAALLALWLSVGSVPLGTQSRTIGPFLFLNALLSAVYHPLTQPVRFLPMAVAALSIGAALGLDRLARLTRHPTAVVGAIAVLALVEAATLGALRIEVQTIDLRTHTCWATARGSGALHFIENGESEGLPTSAVAMLGQLFHENPTTTRGIGGWTRNPQTDDWRVHIERFDQGILARHPGQDWLRAARALHAGGVRWVAVPTTLETVVPAAVIGRCQGWSLWRMSDVQRTVVSNHPTPGVPLQDPSHHAPPHAAVPPPQ